MYTYAHIYLAYVCTQIHHTLYMHICILNYIYVHIRKCQYICICIRRVNVYVHTCFMYSCLLSFLYSALTLINRYVYIYRYREMYIHTCEERYIIANLDTDACLYMYLCTHIYTRLACWCCESR